MLEYHLQRIYIWIAFSIILLAFVLFRWIYYRKFKSDRVKKGDTIHNLSDGTRSTVSKLKSESELMSKTIVNLPSQYSAREMAFIEIEYMEEGILQLKQSHQRECTVLDDQTGDGMKYATIKDIKVNFMVRNNRTLELEARQELRTVKLLFLNEWIR